MIHKITKWNSYEKPEYKKEIKNNNNKERKIFCQKEIFSAICNKLHKYDINMAN